MFTDDEKILRELKKNPKLILQHPYNKYADNVNIMQELVKTCPFTCASDTLKNDKEVVLAVVKAGAKLFKFIPEKFKNDLDFVIQAAKANCETMYDITLNYTKECGYVRCKVKDDGNSGCTGVDVTRAEAYRLLKNNPEVAKLIKPAVLEEFYEGGRAHPSVLQAIACVKGITLCIWQEGKGGALTPYKVPKHGDKYAKYQPKNSIKTIHLICSQTNNYLDYAPVNYRHFDLVEFMGNVDFNKPIFPHYSSWIRNEVEDYPKISPDNMNELHVCYVKLTGDKVHDLIEKAAPSCKDDKFNMLMSLSKKYLTEIEKLTNKKRKKFEKNSKRIFFKKRFGEKNKNEIIEIDEKIKNLWDKRIDIQRSLVYLTIYLLTGIEKQKHNDSEIVKVFGKDGCFIRNNVYEKLDQALQENAAKRPYVLTV